MCQPSAGYAVEELVATLQVGVSRMGFGSQRETKGETALPAGEDLAW